MSGFQLLIDMNYEDTDAGGVVYYGNYLAYMERARAAFLRNCGYSLTQLINDHQLMFVVSQANINYISPAYLDDRIEVGVDVTTFKGPRFDVYQKICRNDEVLVTAEIKLAVLNSQTRKPTRVPDFLRQACIL